MVSLDDCPASPEENRRVFGVGEPDYDDNIIHGCVSDCCGASVYSEDICSECREHCQAVSDSEYEDE